MQNNNYPKWLVPLDIARKLTEIGITDSEILVCNDKYYGWYKAEQMYYINRWGDTYTALEVSKDYNLEPTFTWEQVFEWFRKKDFITNLYYKEDLLSEKTMFIGEICNTKADIISIIHECSTYEEAREALVNKLIEVYKKE